MASRRVRLADRSELAVEIDGEGPDLLLVSGLGGTAAFWEPLVPALARRFRVIRFDQRGIGKSPRGTAALSIELLAEDSLALLAELGRGRPLLIGHSTGGVILQTMALANEAALAGLVLSGTWAAPNRYMRELFRSRRVILDAAPQEYAAMLAFIGYEPDWLDANWPRYEAMLVAAPQRPDQREVVAERIAALLAFDRSGEIGRLHLPILVQGAEDDLIVPAFLQRELAAALPDCELCLLPRGGHFFPVTRSEAFIAGLVGWAERHGLIA